ncbi:MAG: DUF424 domain-containing protein [Promethearchaeota archaeon]
MDEKIEQVNPQSPQKSNQDKNYSCYAKIHSHGSQVVVGVCDEKCLGLKLSKGKFQFSVTKTFFEGKRVSLEEAIVILRNSNNFNAVGSRIIQALIAQKMVHPEAVIDIDGTPIAIKVSS